MTFASRSRALQNYFVVDEEIWSHARPDLADLRIYDGETQVQYALSVQRGGTIGQEAAGQDPQPRQRQGHTEFDLDMAAVRRIRPDPTAIWMPRIS